MCLQLVLGITVPALVIRRDMARLGAEGLDRCWNDASLWSAIAAFGPVAVLVHFARTRRSLRGVVLGLVWAGLTVTASLLLGTFFSLFER